jgi:hypothetical protein
MVKNAIDKVAANESVRLGQMKNGRIDFGLRRKYEAE